MPPRRARSAIVDYFLLDNRAYWHAVETDVQSDANATGKNSSIEIFFPHSPSLLYFSRSVTTERKHATNVTISKYKRDIPFFVIL